MANEYKAEVDLALRAPDAKNLSKTLEEILNAVDQLPGKGGAASKAVQEIVAQIQKIKQAIAETGSFNGVIPSVKELAASLKTIGVLQKSLQLFSNDDIQRINRAELAMRQAAKAAETLNRASQVKSGTFGLDETSIAGVTRATKTLQTELRGVQQTISTLGGKVNGNDPLYQTGLSLEKNISRLQSYRAELVRTMELEKQEQAFIAQGNVMKAQFQESQNKYNAQLAAQSEKMKEQFYASQTGRGQAAQIRGDFDRSETGQAAASNKQLLANRKDSNYADPGYVELKNSQQQLALQNEKNRAALDGLGISQRSLAMSARAAELDAQVVAKKKEIEAALIAENGESAKSIALRREYLNLAARRDLQVRNDRASDPLTQQAAEQSRIDAMVSRTQGTGGAALLKVQLALTANYALLNNVTGAISGAITNSIQFEAALKNVQAVTATTNTEMVGLGANISKLASDSRFSATEVAGAALILGQAGLSAKQVAESLPSVITLATAAGTSLASAVDLVTSIVGVFDKSATDAADVANKITAAANNSKVSVEKLGLAFQYVGNTAAQTGVSFEETTAALAAMSNAGITSGSTLGTGLRHFLTEVQKPSAEFLASLQRIGLSVSDIDIKAHGLIGVIDTLRKAGFVATDAIKSFDIRSASAFNGLIANPDALKNQFDLLQNTQAAVAANTVQMDSLDSQTKRLTTSFQQAVAVGFGPTQTALKAIASAAASFFQVLAEHDGVLKLLVTTLETLVAVTVYNYLSGIGRGFLQISAQAGGVISTLRTLTTVSAEQASSLTGLSGNLGRTGVAIQAWQASMASAAATAGPLQGAIVGVRGAIAGLWAVLVSNPVTVAIAAIGALVGYLALHESAAEKAKNKQDELSASVNNAKGAYDDSQRSVDLLTKKIEDLQYKQTDLEKGGEALRRSAMELNSQFGALGIQVDVNNTSFGQMIEKLRGVRSEMQQLAGLKLNEQIAAKGQLIDSQTEQLSQSLVQQRAGTGAGDRLQRYVSQYNVLGSQAITGSQKDQIVEAIKTLKQSGQPGFLNSNENVIALRNAALALDNVSKTLPADARKGFEEFSKTFQATTSQAFELGKNRIDQANLISERDKRDSSIKFQNAPVFAGKTFEQVLPTARDFQGPIKEANPNASLTELYDKTKEAIVTDLHRIDDIVKTGRDLLRDHKITEDDFANLQQQAKTRASQLATTGREYWNAVQEQYKTETEGQIRLAKARSGDKGLGNKLDPRRTAEQLKVGDLQAKLATAGVFGTNETAEAKARYARELAEANAQKMRNSYVAPKDRTAQRDDQAEEAALKQEAAHFEVLAKGNKIAAGNAANLDEVDNLIDAGLQNLAQAKAKQVEALLKEQAAKTPPEKMTPIIAAANADAVQALKDTADERMVNYVQGASKIYAAVAKRSTRFGAQADAEEAAIRLQKLKSEADDALFTVSRPLAQTKIDVAAGKANPNSTLEKVQELAVTKTQIDALTKQLSYYTDYIAALSAAADDAKARLDKAREDVKNASPETRAGKEAILGIAENNYRDRNKELRTATEGQRTTRNQLDKAQETSAAQQLSIPQEASFDNINAKIQQTLTNYKQAVTDFDQVGTIGAGVKDTLDGLAGNFASLFENIATGSMTAGQAFKSFAAGIIKSMLNIIAQALAMQAIKGLLQAIGFVWGGGGTAATGVQGGTSGSVLSVGTSMQGSKGGQITTSGFVRAATGGEMKGGTPGKDSIPTMLMPGEFVLNTKAVDAIGLDTLHALNSSSANTVAQSNSGTRSQPQGQPQVHNTYIITPDQKPSLGPRDVVVIMSDELNKGNGSFTRLVKSVATGQQ